MKSHTAIKNAMEDILWVKCLLCQEEMPLKKYNEHLNTFCPLVKVQCSWCKEPNIYRKDLSSHKLRRCLKNLFPHPFHSEKEKPVEEKKIRKKKRENEEFSISLSPSLTSILNINSSSNVTPRHSFSPRLDLNSASNSNSNPVPNANKNLNINPNENANADADEKIMVKCALCKSSISQKKSIKNNDVILCLSCANSKTLSLDSKTNPHLRIPCENQNRGCNQILPQEQMQHHLLTECSHRIVKCPFAKWGCQESIYACDLSNHLTAFQSAHLFFKIDALDQQVNGLNKYVNGLHEQMDELQQKNQQLNTQVHELQETKQQMDTELTKLQQTVSSLRDRNQLLYRNEKLAVFVSGKNEQDQSILFFNCTQRQPYHPSITWFNSHSFINSGSSNKSPLMFKSNHRDMIWVKELKTEQLKRLGLANLQFPKSTYSLIVRASHLQNETIGLLLSRDDLVSFELPKFNHIVKPDQILFHDDLGLICVDIDCFTKCEQLWLSEESIQNKKEEGIKIETEEKKENSKDYNKSNEMNANWTKLPLFENKKIDCLSGAVICKMKNGWNEPNNYRLFTHSANNGLTAMLNFNNQQWIDLKDNTLNKSEFHSCVYDWKERNEGNIVFINCNKTACEFDLHKQEWFKLPNINYSPYQLYSYARAANVFVHKEHGLLTVMSYHTISKERGINERGIVEMFDTRDKNGWNVIKSESECLTQILPFHSQMKDNQTYCHILGGKKKKKKKLLQKLVI